MLKFVLLLLVASTTQNPGATTVDYLCLWDGVLLTATIEVTLNQDDGAATAYEAVFAGTTGDSTCKVPKGTAPFSDVAIGGENTFTYTVTLADGDTQDCEMVQTAAASSIWVLHFSPMSFAEGFAIGDLDYPVSCDFNAATNILVEDTAGIAQVTAVFTTGTVTQTPPGTITLEVFDSGFGSTIVAANFGVQIGLRATFTKVPGSYQYFKAMKCYAYLDVLNSVTKLKIIGDSGCGNPRGGLFVPGGAANRQGFTGHVDLAPVDATKRQMEVLFETFIFQKTGGAGRNAGGATIFYECTFKLCLTGDASCDAGCNDGTFDEGSRRKRRSANETDNVKQEFVSIQILPPGTLASGTSATYHGNATDIAEIECSYFGYIVGMGILAFLLLITLGLVFLFFGRVMRKQRSQNEKA